MRMPAERMSPYTLLECWSYHRLKQQNIMAISQLLICVAALSNYLIKSTQYI